jgi:predicted permease
MKALRSLILGLRALFGKERRGRELDEELRNYLEAATEHNMLRGMNREHALRAARVEIGSMETVKQKVWSAGWESIADAIWQDLRYAVRQLLKSPGFTTVAILSLALGIGANTAIFTLINALLLKSLPVHEPQQLVSFGKADGGGILGGFAPGPVDAFSYDFYQRLEKDHPQFQDIAAYGSFPVQVSVRESSAAAGPATQAFTHLVSGNFFSVLGADPLLGRVLSPDDAASPGRGTVAVLSHRYWQQALAADPSVVGHTLNINGTFFTVVGVMPAQFYGVDLNEEMTDMWLPLTMQPQVMLSDSLIDPNGMFWLHFIARRKANASIPQAQAWVNAQWRQAMVDREGASITQDRRREINGNYVVLLPGSAGVSHLRTDYEQPLTILMGIVVVVLLIACANLANFLLAKSAARERELTTRLALGSSRKRIVSQILTETLLLSFIGGALGLLIAFWGTTFLIRFIAGHSAHTPLTARPDLHVLCFTTGICILTGLFFGVAPALRISRLGVSGVLNSGTRTAASGGGRSGRLLPNALVAAQIMLSLVLIAVAGLLMRTIRNLHNHDLGFNQTSLLNIRTNARFAGYKPGQLNPLYDRILTRLDALPGVRSATISNALPIARGHWGSPIDIIGRPAAPHEEVDTLLNRVSSGYFETIGIALLRGRTIGAEDTATSQKSVVVNKTFADRYFPHGDAIGHSFTVGDPSVAGTWRIVGVVRDSSYRKAGEQIDPMTYLPVVQLTGDDNYAGWIQVQTHGDPAQMTAQVRAALAGIDPNLPILDVETMSDVVDHIIDQQRLISQLSTFFSLLALSLACIGLYGVMSYNVVRRTNEIGLRIALGASTSSVLWMILRESLILLLIGVAIGLPATFATSKAIQSELFGLKPYDPLTIVAAILTIAVVTLASASLPARRASKIDPMIALRYE